MMRLVWILGCTVFISVVFFCFDCFGGHYFNELASIKKRRYVPARDWTTCDTDSKTGHVSCTHHHKSEEWNVFVASQSGRGWIDSRSLYETSFTSCTAKYSIGRYTEWLWGPISCDPVDLSMFSPEKVER